MEETSNKEDAPVAFLDRASLATRGKRTTKLHDGEIEEDELLWNQDALKSNKNDIAVNKRTAYNERGWNVPDDAEGERTVRKSPRTAVIVRQAERDAKRAAMQAKMMVWAVNLGHSYPQGPKPWNISLVSR
ncbi:hypothetical protein Patl1_24307 [Pistacia atlantica]|uniref:Uncharacterized protein n=1 Tax=Pistacia atlantica TaxID=434234 RepID=A0ACC0ZWH3_9ROSI|nr:hypothetical protein Patl1_24307 [Pistacia atlantica]